MKSKVQFMFDQLINEFNCNHAAELDDPNQTTIYERDEEHNKIRNFLCKNIMK